MGPKDRQLYAKYQKIILDLIDDLHKKKLIKKMGTISDVEVLNVLNRINLSGDVINKLDHKTAPSIWPTFIADLSKHGIMENDFLNIYFILLTSQMLDLFELIKKIFLAILENNPYGKTTITGNETLGNLVDKLEIISPKNGFHDCIDNGLRNALGHGWYWFKNNEFHYKAGSSNKTTKKLTIAEFLIKLREINLLANCIADDGMTHVKQLP